MKHTTKLRRKAPRFSAKHKMLAAGSALAIAAVSSALVAQTAGDRVYSGGYTTSGIPVTDDAFGAISGNETIAPTQVGAAQGQAARSTVPGETTTLRRGRWTTSITPYVEGTATYSDNINLDRAGQEEDELVLSATAGVDVGIQSERLSGSLSYAASYDHYVNNTNDDGLRHNLNTGWSAAIVPNLLYLDAGAGVTEVFIDSDDRFSGNPVANGDDRTRAYFGSISPSIRKNIGGWANAELRYGLSGEAYEDDALDSSFTNIYRASLTSDPNRFRKFGWAAVSEYEDFQPDAGDDFQRWSSSVSVDVPVSRTLALTAAVGYDQFSDNLSSDDDLDGVYGNVGVRYQANQRLNGQAYVGYRYGGIDYGVAANYALRNNMVASLTANRAVEFANFDRAGFELQAAQAGLVIPEQTFALLDEDGVVDTVTASLSGSVGKTGYNVNASALRRDLAQDETVVSANLGLTRQLTPRISGELGAGYSRFSVDGNSIDDFDVLALGAGLSYQLTEIVNVFGRYTYTERFADDSADEFKENAGIVGVTASF